MITRVKIDTSTEISQKEANWIVTHFRGLGKRIKYRELIGFSPADASKTEGAEKYGISAEEIARAARRDK